MHLNYDNDGNLILHAQTAAEAYQIAGVTRFILHDNFDVRVVFDYANKGDVALKIPLIHKAD